MMFKHACLFIALFLVNILYSQSNEEAQNATAVFATMEGEPSGIVNGTVNTLNGLHFEDEVDFIIPGPEKVAIRRTYTNLASAYKTSKGFPAGQLLGWEFGKYTVLTLKTIVYLDNEPDVMRRMEGSSSFSVEVADPYGATVSYIGGFKDSAATNPVRLNLHPDCISKGMTNTSSGEISGRTNLKNSYAVFDRNTGGGGTVYVISGDGTKRHYRLHQYGSYDTSYQEPGSAYGPSTIHSSSTYLLMLEERPSGRHVHYRYDSNGHLLSVTTSDAACTRTLGAAHFFYNADKRTPGGTINHSPCVTAQISNGRSIHYEIQSKRLLETHFFQLAKVQGRLKPPVSYEYGTWGKRHGDYKDGEFPHAIKTCAYPEGRFLQTEYYTESKRRKPGTVFIGDRAASFKNGLGNGVSMQLAPVGHDDTPIPVARFFYYYNRPARSPHEQPYQMEQGGRTEVLDALGHNTVYLYQPGYRLHVIGRYDRFGQHVFREQLAWGADNTPDAANLLYRSWSDDRPLAAKGYVYDERGNVLEERLYGNHTGKSCDLQIDYASGHVIANGVECEVKHSTYSNDGFNLPLTITESNGKTTHTSYVPGTNLLQLQLTSHHGRIYDRHFYQYDQFGVLSKEIVDDGSSGDINDLQNVTERHITYIHTRQTHPGLSLPEIIEEKYLQDGQELLLKKTVYTYTPHDQVASKEIFDANNQSQYQLFYEYDDNDLLVRETDPLGNETRYGYDANFNLISIEGPRPNVQIQHEYDFSNRLIRSIERHADGTIYVKKNSYDYLGNKTSSEDIYGNVTDYEYNCLGQCIKTTLPAIQACDQSSHRPQATKKYNVFGHVLEETNSEDQTTRFKNTVKGKPYEITHPDGCIETFEYHIDGTLHKSIHKNGSYKVYTYDYQGRVLSTDTYSPAHAFIARTTSTYNAFHQTSSTDAEGTTTFFSYDGAGRLVSTLKADQKITYEYDPNGHQRIVKQWHGPNPTDFTAQITERDVANRVIEEREEDGSGALLKKVVYTYDNFGNKLQTIEFISANETATTFCEYNSRNQLIKCTNPQGHVTHYTYNEAFTNDLGQLVQQKTVTDPLGNQIVTTLNALSQIALVQRKNNLGVLLAQTEYRYDGSGNKLRQIDTVIASNAPNRQITIAWEYGPCKRLEKQIEAFGDSLQRETLYIYNDFGQLKEKIRPGGIKLIHEYDSEGRLSSFYSQSPNDFAPIRYTYTYNANGKVTQVIDQILNQTIERFYTPTGQLSKEILANGFELTSSYNPSGRRKTLQLPHNNSILFNYHGSRFQSITLNTPQKSYTHTYLQRDLRGFPLKASTPSGPIEYKWDTLGRRLGISSQWSETIPEGGYDPSGNLKSSTLKDTAGQYTHTFALNDLYQLTQESGAFSNTYTLDSLNNRLNKNQKVHQHNNLNQLLSDGLSTFTYDATGNLIAKKTGNQLINYRYDVLDRLVAITQDEHISVQFTYDSFNRRTSKKTYQWNNTSQTWNLYTQLNFLHDDQDEIGATDLQNNLLEFRVLGEGLGAEIGAAILVSLDNNLYTPIHDHRGTLTALINPSTQTIAECYRYSAFGEEQIYDSSGNQLQSSSLGNPWRFSSKRTDDETGLIYYGRRYYSPSTGRWITTDPQGYADGPNLYAYLNHNPLTLIDLYGLAAVRERDSGFHSGFRRFNEAMNYIGRSITNFIDKAVDYFARGIEAIGLHTGLFPLQILGRAMRGTINTPCGFTERAGTFVVGNKELKNAKIIFCNGMLNVQTDGLESAQFISTSYSGAKVYFTLNPSQGFACDIGECIANSLGVHTSPVQALVNNISQCIQELGGPESGGRIILIAHSQGGLLSNLAVKTLTPAERNMIDIYTFGSAKIIAKSAAGNVVNFVGVQDAVPMTDPIGLARGLFKDHNIRFVGSMDQIPFINHAFVDTYGGVVERLGREHY